MTWKRISEFFRGLEKFDLDSDPELRKRDRERRALKLAELRYRTGEVWPSDRLFDGGFFHPEGEFYYLSFDGRVVCELNPSGMGGKR